MCSPSASCAIYCAHAPLYISRQNIPLQAHPTSPPLAQFMTLTHPTTLTSSSSQTSSILPPFPPHNFPLPLPFYILWRPDPDERAPCLPLIKSMPTRLADAVSSSSFLTSRLGARARGTMSAQVPVPHHRALNILVPQDDPCQRATLQHEIRLTTGELSPSHRCRTYVLNTPL